MGNSAFGPCSSPADGGVEVYLHVEEPASVTTPDERRWRVRWVTARRNDPMLASASPGHGVGGLWSTNETEAAAPRCPWTRRSLTGGAVPGPALITGWRVARLAKLEGAQPAAGERQEHAVAGAHPR